MFRRDSLTGFALRAALVYALLVVLWPLLHDGYATAFRAVSNTAFASFGSGGQAAFRPVFGDAGNMDTQIICTNRRAPGFQSDRLRLNTHYAGYVPLITLIALTVATPLPWHRRAWGLLWGVPLVHAFVGLRLTIILLDAFSYDNPIRAVNLSPAVKGALVHTIDAVVKSVFMCSFFVPAFCWVLATFRRGDWQRWHAASTRQS